MEHPIFTAVARAGFVALGWFAPRAENRVPASAKYLILIGNAGPGMFQRFASARDPSRDKLDAWTRDVVDRLARDVDAEALYPFDDPPLPFLTWARRAGAGYVSPLGLNVHPSYGLWHAYRAALLFPVAFDLPQPAAGAHPCEACTTRPCLSACPVAAFDGSSYDVSSCVRHIAAEVGLDCMERGCLARRACPVGREYRYSVAQTRFHMTAFLKARLADAADF